MENLTDILIRIAVLAPAILMALTVHEASHALVAHLMGDSTAKFQGRLSLNPLHHLDPTGTLVFFITAWFGAGIGWAKPVPVDSRNLKNPQRDHIWISAAGPAANIVFAVLIALCLALLIHGGLFRSYSLFVWIMGQLLIAGVKINLVLAFFNLIPLPPLDGSGILAGLLPYRAAARYYEIGRYGFLIILGLIFLPNWLPGFPDIINLFVLTPANTLASWLLPL